MTISVRVRRCGGAGAREGGGWGEVAQVRHDAADGAWKPAEAVRDPRGPIWPSATSIQGFLLEL
jgi:hypothetical protein